MFNPSDRLRHNARTWVTDFGLRAFGAMLLGASYSAALALHRQAATAPYASAKPAEFAIAAAVVVLLTCGLAFLVEGVGLFSLVPLPPRSLWN